MRQAAALPGAARNIFIGSEEMWNMLQLYVSDK